MTTLCKIFLFFFTPIFSQIEKQEKRMRMRLPTILGIAAALAAATVLAQTTRPADSSATTTPVTQMSAADRLEQQWAAVLQKLGSEEFKERESAQKEVEKATRHDLPALRALADKQTDAEIKQRLLKRVDELLVQVALDPPPIDLDIQDGTLHDLTDALTKATGTEFKQWNSFQRETFTLHVKEKPFWDVFMALSAQHPLRIQGNALLIAEPGIVWGDPHGALLFYPVSLSRTVNLQAGRHDRQPHDPPDHPAPAAAGAKLLTPALDFSYGVLGDPRLKLETSSMPQITSVVDDKGHVLYHADLANNGTMGMQGMLQFQTAARWPVPEGVGRTLTVKGQMKISVVISEVTVEVPDMQKQGNTPIQIMNEELVWSKFEPKNGIINFQMNIQRRNPAPAMQATLKPVRITLVDANGRQLISQSIQGGWGGGLPGSDALPIKAIFSIPTRSEEQTIPFEFKDLPVP
jgi:hypothetical protein